RLGNSASYYEISSLQVQFGTNQVPTATISMKTPDGNEASEACTGSGSVEAIYNTLERLIDAPVRLEDYRIQSTSGGRDSLAEVYVKILFNDVTSSGRGTAQDVLEASAKAYINAVNRVLLQEQYREELQKA